jgi:predicted Zn-dependent peptidase
MNALFDQYAKLTPEDVQAAAKLLVERGRTIVTLTGPGGAK